MLLKYYSLVDQKQQVLSIILLTTIKRLTSARPTAKKAQRPKSNLDRGILCHGVV